MTNRPKPVRVEIARDSYQPSKEELEADTRVDATFEEAVSALAKPVEVVRVARHRRDR